MTTQAKEKISLSMYVMRENFSNVPDTVLDEVRLCTEMLEKDEEMGIDSPGEWSNFENAGDNHQYASITSKYWQTNGKLMPISKLALLRKYPTIYKVTSGEIIKYVNVYSATKIVEADQERRHKLGQQISDRVRQRVLSNMLMRDLGEYTNGFIPADQVEDDVLMKFLLYNETNNIRLVSELDIGQERLDNLKPLRIAFMHQVNAKFERILEKQIDRVAPLRTVKPCYKMMVVNAEDWVNGRFNCQIGFLYVAEFDKKRYDALSENVVYEVTNIKIGNSGSGEDTGNLDVNGAVTIWGTNQATTFTSIFCPIYANNMSRRLSSVGQVVTRANSTMWQEVDMYGIINKLEFAGDCLYITVYDGQVSTVEVKLSDPDTDMYDKSQLKYGQSILFRNLKWPTYAGNQNGPLLFQVTSSVQVDFLINSIAPFYRTVVDIQLEEFLQHHANFKLDNMEFVPENFSIITDKRIDPPILSSF